MTLDFSNGDLVKLMEEVQTKDDKSKRWVIFGIEAGTKIKDIPVTVVESGSEYEECCEELFEATTEIYWAYCRFKMGDFYRWALYSYVGVGAGKRHCGMFSVYNREVENIFLKKLVHIRVPSAKLELIEDEEKILEKVKRGSNLYFSKK